MTTLTTGAGASASLFVDTSGAGLLALFTGSVASGTPTATTVTVQTAGGLLVALNGASLSGFGSNGLPGSGLIGSVSVRTAAGVEIYALTNLLVTAANLSSAVAAANAAALNYMFFLGNDTLAGSAFGDVISASNGNDNVDGQDGDDTLDGGDGVDELLGGRGLDNLSGGQGRDTLRGGDGNDTLAGGTEDDLLYGDADNDVLRGDAGNDVLYGDAGNDTLEGGAGQDLIFGGAGNDSIDGGAGNDTLSFAGVSTAVVASLAAGTVSHDGDTDTFTSIESLVGGSGNDTLTGGDAITLPAQPNLIKPATLVNSFGNYFSLDGSFDLEADPNITNSTIVPHATVYARAHSAGYFSEHYSFTTTAANSTVTIDIDSADAGFDAEFYLYRLDSFGNYNYLQWVPGNSSLDPGSTSNIDPYLTRTLSTAATYVILVQPSGSISFNPSYTLHVSIDGGSSRPLLDGAAGDDNLAGGTASETLSGGAGSDTVSGGAGNDLVVATAAELVAGESMAGGDGIDTLRLTAGNGPLDLRNYVVSGFEVLDIQAAEITMSGEQALAFGNSLSVINSSSGGAEVLRIAGSQATVDLSGWTFTNWESFRDVLVLDGTATATAYFGSSIYEQVDYSGSSAGISASLSASVNNTGDAAGDSYVGIEQINGTAFGDVLSGDAAVNALYGGAGNDVLYGYAGADNLLGGEGDDILEGGAGADFLDGGAGFDTVSYASSAGPVQRSFSSSSAAGVDAVGDVLFNIEALVGSAFADVLSGASNGDTLAGGFGSDWLLGFGGADTLRGDAGNDVLVGGAGADTLAGGAGDDVAYYRDAAAGVAASLAAGGSAGEAEGDSYAGIENLWGSDFVDTLAGDGAANQVYGFAGADTLDGAGGDDTVYGGMGADTLTGGAGADSFYYLQWQTDGGDTLTDFTGGTDRILLSRFWFGIDTTGPAAALQASEADFITSGGGVTSARPSFLWNSGTGVLTFDPDGVGGTSSFVLATLQVGASLSLSDIWSA